MKAKTLLRSFITFIVLHRKRNGGLINFISVNNSDEVRALPFITAVSDNAPESWITVGAWFLAKPVPLVWCKMIHADTNEFR